MLCISELQWSFHEILVFQTRYSIKICTSSIAKFDFEIPITFGLEGE